MPQAMRRRGPSGRTSGAPGFSGACNSLKILDKPPCFWHYEKRLNKRPETGDFIGSGPLGEGGAMQEKKMDKTFGAMAVEKGFITQEALDEALSIQMDELKAQEKARPIGRILLNEGLITMQQVGEVLKALEKWN